ncbi:hypothetical protein V2J09_007192 [Rumex salicifolius]
MQAKIVFCTAVSLAILAVILLAALSPFPARRHDKNTTTIPWVALSLYIQQPQVAAAASSSNTHNEAGPTSKVLVFHRTLTEGPEISSRVVGKAQGFIIPVEQFAHSAFNIIYLTFDTPEYSGSVSLQAKKLAYKEMEELVVVGGTGSFAFAKGLALFAETDKGSSNSYATYQVKLQLEFPNRSQMTIEIVTQSL